MSEKSTRCDRTAEMPAPAAPMDQETAWHLTWALRAALAIGVFLLAVLAGLLIPGSADAREYRVSKVDIDLTVNTDGSLSVVEDRTFEFDGEFNGVYWDVSTKGPEVRAGSESLELEDVSVEDVTAGTGAMAQVAAGCSCFRRGRAIGRRMPGAPLLL